LRLLLFLLLLLAPSSGALAQNQATADWWRSLPETERYAIQADLVLLGLYDGFVDGTYGPLTERAIGQFQLSFGETGPTPSRAVLDDLRRRANEAYARFGIRLEQDPESGVAAFVPRALLTVSKPGNDGGRVFATPDDGIVLFLDGWDYPETGLQGLATEILKPVAGRTVTYSAVRDDRIVWSGRQDGDAYYGGIFVDYPKVVLVIVSWADRYARDGATIATFVASYSGTISRLQQFEAATPAPTEQQAAAQQQAVPSIAGERFGAFILPDEDTSSILLAGDITAGSAMDFIRAIRKRPEATTVELSSNGGSVEAGLLIAHQVAATGLATHVPEGAHCYSACAYIFFAGKARSADGALGVHQIYGDEISASDAQDVLSDVLEALEGFGVPQAVISTMLRTRPNEMYVFTEAELASLEIAPPADKAATKHKAAERPSGPKAAANAAGPRIAAIDPAAVAGNQALLLEASDNGITGAVPFAGTVDWSTGQDEWGQLTLLGKASIPARGLSADVLIRKNSDASLPASQMMEISFALTDAFVGGAITALPGVLLKSEALVQGSPLTGSSARVVDNAFLFALASSPSEREANLELLGRPWLDLALVYASGKRAVLTLEKDGPAQDLFSEAILSWRASPYIDSDAAEPSGIDAGPERLDLGL
jgi:peptidoglycan hydrolase-like protein with peptidoglycan-binding domain